MWLKINKEQILEKYKNKEDKLLIAKLIDKIQIEEKQNKLVYTNFLDTYQKNIVEKTLKQLNKENVIFYGGYDNSERTICIIYPEKLKNISKEILGEGILEIIRINLPKESFGKFVHRQYLGALMKIGLQREKIGDILVEENGADIIVMKEISKYIKENIGELTRFSKAKIEILKIENLRKVTIKKQEIKVIVSSLRLDNIVSELTKTSRKNAEEIIKQERVFINYELQTKNTKHVKEKDKITIRGKGKFEIKEIVGETKNGRIVVLIEKYV